MIVPPSLNPGDCIGITCPSSKMEAAAAEFAAGVFRDWGFRVRSGKTVGMNFHNFSAPDALRREELQMMLDDPGIQAIVFGRGGYGMLRILDDLDFSTLRSAPKWIAGFSDITALHAHLQEVVGVASLHSVMCSGIREDTFRDPFVASLRECLSGAGYDYRFEAHPLNRPGLAQGRLVGGNLSLLANLSGSPSQPKTEGKILVLEDVGEYRYNIDRMLRNLKRAGWLENLAGLVLGSFTDIRETETPFGQSEYEMVQELTASSAYPVAMGFPCGHQTANYTLKLGLEHRLEVDSSCRLQVLETAVPPLR